MRYGEEAPTGVPKRSSVRGGAVTRMSAERRDRKGPRRQREPEETTAGGKELQDGHGKMFRQKPGYTVESREPEAGMQHDSEKEP